MSMTTWHCPKCGGGMEEGFIIDTMYGGARQVSHWARGAPQKSRWRGTRIPEDRVMPVRTFRCTSCGYLESFARDESSAR